jgi:uncharacterized protein YndB with AHSA1/START domain
MSPDLLVVRESRRYSAQPEVVFEAISRAEYVAQWLSPSDAIQTEVTQFDFRLGGRFRLGFSEGSKHYGFVSGEYIEIRVPERIVFTWTWEPPDAHAGIETEVEIELTAIGGETELVLTHRRFPASEMRTRHAEGWAGALTRLERLMEKGKRNS